MSSHLRLGLPKGLFPVHVILYISWSEHDAARRVLISGHNLLTTRVWGLQMNNWIKAEKLLFGIRNASGRDRTGYNVTEVQYCTIQSPHIYIYITIYCQLHVLKIRRVRNLWLACFFAVFPIVFKLYSSKLLTNSKAYGTRRFNAVFTRVLQNSLPRAESILFLILTPISLRSVLILSSQISRSILQFSLL